MTEFSSITAEEFLRLNQYSLPPGVLKYFDELLEQIKELQTEISALKRSDELAWEQVLFAKDLIENLDHFAEFNLSKAKKVVYNQIRENSYFEV